MSDTKLDRSTETSPSRKAIVFGSGQRAADAARELRASGLVTLVGAAQADEPADIAVFTDALDAGLDNVRMKLESGSDVFLSWPPCASPEEGDALLALADESGVSVGVAAPLAFCSWAPAIPKDWTAQLVTLSLVSGRNGELRSIPWTNQLAGALQFVVRLVSSPETTRVDAQLEPEGEDVSPGAVALCLRFQNGAFAQLLIRKTELAERDDVSCYASGGGVRLEARALDAQPKVIRDGLAEMPITLSEDTVSDVLAFTRAVIEKQPLRISLETALDTMRLVESVQQRLR